LPEAIDLNADGTRTVAISLYGVNAKDPLTTSVNGPSEWTQQDSNLRSLPCQGSTGHFQPVANEEVMATAELACTAACTSDANSVNSGRDDARAADPLAGLTAAALKLSKADRQRLLVALAASLGVDDD
jgi:hypothetical protein